MTLIANPTKPSVLEILTAKKLVATAMVDLDELSKYGNLNEIERVEPLAVFILEDVVDLLTKAYAKLATLV